MYWTGALGGQHVCKTGALELRSGLGGSRDLAGLVEALVRAVQAACSQPGLAAHCLQAAQTLLGLASGLHGSTDQPCQQQLRGGNGCAGGRATSLCHR